MTYASNILTTVAIRRQLSNRGWVQLTDVGGSSAAEAILTDLGEFVSQDKGELRYDVRTEAQGDGLSSSKSSNPLNPHTDASYHAEPPHYLALWCSRAARCGGGQTVLADGAAIFDHLDSTNRETATCHPVEFSDATHLSLYQGPVVSLGEPLRIRFSYNLLRFGKYDPALSEIATALPASTPKEHLAEQFAMLFETLQLRLLIPDDGLLVIDNHRMLHSRTGFRDTARHLIRYWLK